MKANEPEMEKLVVVVVCIVNNNNNSYKALLSNQS